MHHSTYDQHVILWHYVLDADVHIIRNVYAVYPQKRGGYVEKVKFLRIREIQEVKNNCKLLGFKNQQLFGPTSCNSEFRNMYRVLGMI